MVRIKVDADIELKAMGQRDRAMVFDTVDQNRGHLRKWLPWVDYMTSAEDYIGVIKAWQEDIDNGVGLQLGIFHKGKFVGMCGYNEIFFLSKRGQLGYWISKEGEGKGIVMRSVRKLVEYGFSRLELNRIEIICGEYNYRSRALPEAMGFTKEAVLADYEFLYDHYHDCIMYRQLKREYDAGQP